jgi:hypothetical protein
MSHAYVVQEVIVQWEGLMVHNVPRRRTNSGCVCIWGVSVDGEGEGDSQCRVQARVLLEQHSSLLELRVHLTVRGRASQGVRAWGGGGGVPVWMCRHP